MLYSVHLYLDLGYTLFVILVNIPRYHGNRRLRTHISQEPRAFKLTRAILSISIYILSISHRSNSHIAQVNNDATAVIEKQ